jgi:hypothetical protein
MMPRTTQRTGGLMPERVRLDPYNDVARIKLSKIGTAAALGAVGEGRAEGQVPLARLLKARGRPPRTM